MRRIRVLVVEDSITVQMRLCEVLGSDPEIEVVGRAGDGKRGIELCRELRPDVITLDMMLPLMSGLAATEYIMAHCPTPILIVSASLNRGELFKTYDALAAGAVEVMEKPDCREEETDWDGRFLATVKLVSRIRVITHPKGRLSPIPSRGAPSAERVGEQPCKVVAIGASTGGPGAILELLRALPKAFPLPMLIALHLNETTGVAFAEWLDGLSSHRVAFARDGQALGTEGPGVWLAPPGRHLVLEGGTLALTLDAERHSCRPSVDVLFESVATSCGASAVGCLLTGMGRDGAAGLLKIRKAGGLTLAQDEATSVVYGMPREARILGAAERILPLEAIGPFLARLAAGAP